MSPSSSTVDTISCIFSVDSTLSKVSTFITWVERLLTQMQRKLPRAINSKGNIRLAISYSHYRPSPISVDEDMTSEAHVDSAKEPKRSALIPATSPTLSPTLSAIVAGFLGLSSGRPAYTLPTRSAPTSAALVYMPPPTRPKRATKDPPRPYPAIASNNDL